MVVTASILGAGVLAAIADRRYLQRNKLELVSIGEPVIEGELVKIPLGYFSPVKNLRGSRMECLLSDNDVPTYIIAGAARTLDMAHQGYNEEYLTFPVYQLRSGAWDVQVSVTYGDCRWNPLYRLFGMRSVLRKTIRINPGVNRG